jgi:hypothetical protein
VFESIRKEKTVMKRILFQLKSETKRISRFASSLISSAASKSYHSKSLMMKIKQLFS